ncbi:hypothetical protein [Pollutibacter soli]|uniref:hypothetical protein n=1 Tax=Pollutibacter soli TaxID=3034157 RepID=UPI00301357BA
MKNITITFSFVFFILILNAQEIKFRENIDKDSLLEVSIKRFPEHRRKEIIKEYKVAGKEEKEWMLFMLSLPSSSKKELIDNYENKKPEILKLKAEYRKYVPADHIVYIEFEPESKILTIPEQITIKVYRKRNNEGKKDYGSDNVVRRPDDLIVVSQNWNLLPGSPELDKILQSLHWTTQTLAEIKKLLTAANCISIENQDVTSVGFARSGMGKYSYKIFDENLTREQTEAYSDGCAHIYYRDNIVLEYGGGAIGPQCFEKE